MSINLDDSGRNIEEISIVILIRQNQDYLPKLFNMLEKLEKAYKVKINYTFLENGSKDNSVKMITEFLNNKVGTVTTLEMTDELDKLPRTVKMSFLRNKAN